MNPRDRDNLHFLLSASPELLARWYEVVPPDDREYAGELLNRAYVENVLLADDPIEDVTLANLVLDKFR